MYAIFTLHGYSSSMTGPLCKILSNQTITMEILHLK